MLPEKLANHHEEGTDFTFDRINPDALGNMVKNL